MEASLDRFVASATLDIKVRSGKQQAHIGDGHRWLVANQVVAY
jgi:hypothetical protein